MSVVVRAEGKRRVVVVGGGISGLSTAYYLRELRPDLEVVLLEARDRVGGNIVTEARDGFLIDGGPDSFLRTKPEAVALCKALGLESDFISTREGASTVYIVHEGRLELMPAGMALTVPTRLGPMMKTPLLSLGGKLRMLGDLVLPSGWGQNGAHGSGDSDESIAAFVARRFGSEAADKLAAPLLGGIYAGDVASLSIRATFPQLSDLEDRYGSLVFGFYAAQNRERARQWRGSTLRRLGDAPRVWRWLKREGAHAASPFQSLRRGMGSLIDAIAASLPAGTIRTSTVVRGIQRVGDRYRIALADQLPLDVDAVIVAAPAHAAARILPQGRATDDLAQIPYVSTATVFFAFDPRALPELPVGAGFVAPRGEARVVAATWISSKWDHRAPEGHILLRAFLSDAQSGIDIAAADDDELVALARSELERLSGSLPEPAFTRIFRYIRSNPQPTVGHLARLTRINRDLGAMPGLYVTGAAYEGVGIPDCVRQGKAAAERAVARLG